MPQQHLTETRQAYLLNVLDALRRYIEDGCEVRLETTYSAEDRGTIALEIDLAKYQPVLTELMERRFGMQGAPPAG